VRVGALGVLIFGACSAGGFEDPRASLDESDCRHPVSVLQRDQLDIACFLLSVPEVRDDPESKLAELPVTVFSPTRDSDAPPILYLEGGPGGSSIFFAIEAQPTKVNAMERPLIAFEQRGASLATPALECTSGMGCGPQFAAGGIRTDGYNVLESARDVCTAIDQLGLGLVALHGVSYGTAVAQEALRICPERIYAAWLDGVIEMDRPWSADLGLALQASLDRIFLVCSTQAECNAAYPDLAGKWTRLLDTAPKERDGEHIAGPDLVHLMFGGLYDPRFVPFVPLVIHLISEGRTAEIEDIDWFGRFPRQMISGFAVGMHQAVSCNDDAQYLDLDEFARRHADIHPVIREYFLSLLTAEKEECSHYRLRAPEPKVAVTTDVPVLVTGGSYDPITPVAGAERVAQRFSHGTFVKFADGGHGLLHDECATSLWKTFLEHPHQPLVTTCAGRRTVEFVIEP